MNKFIKKIEEKKILVLNIEYENVSGAMSSIIDSLDKQYGKYLYRIMRSGPKGNGSIDEGLAIIHVDIKE